MIPGPLNAITDVRGVLVGQHQRIGEGWATGVTAVLAPEETVGGVDARGGAPGTRETDLLDPANLVRHVHGVCLAGGSSYGLAAADGVVRWLAERSIGFPVGDQPHQVVPIVPGAVIFDLRLGDWGNRPDASFGYAACDAAGSGPVAQGCVGAGAGARAGSVKGGVGTASAMVAGFTVGALAVVNPLGEVVDRETGRPWALDFELAGEFGLRVPGKPGVGLSSTRSDLNTTIGVVAVDAALSKAECRRLAMSAQDGLARAIRPAHSLFDGDTVFTLATGTRELSPGDHSGRAAALDTLCSAAADVFARSVVHGVLAATGAPGLPAYRDVWPGD